MYPFVERRFPIIFLHTFLIFLLFSALTGCGGNSSTAVSGQGESTTIEIPVSARIFSGVPEGKGNTPCSYTCELNVTAGSNSIVKAQATFSNQILKCDPQGEPETNQIGIETTFKVDLNDVDVKEGIVVQTNCAPSKGDLVNTVTLGLIDGTDSFSDSAEVNVQECFRQSNCKIDSEMTSLLGSVADSGLLTLAGSFTCPTLMFFHSSCTVQSTWCSSLEFLGSVAGCDLGGLANPCGNGQMDTGEACDVTCTGDCLPCNPGSTCVSPNHTGECTCAPSENRCSDAKLEEGDTCDAQSNPCPQDGPCSLKKGDVICECPPIKCVASAEVCTDGCDNDGDKLIDCNDPDCSSDPTCQAVCGNGIIETGENCETGPPPPCPIGQKCPIVKFSCSSDVCNPVSCTCPPPVGDICNDGLVEKGSTCDGPHSGIDDCGAQGLFCRLKTFADKTTGCRCLIQTEAGSCNDSIDNDDNGLTDCADLDCAGDPACVSGPSCCAPGFFQCKRYDGVLNPNECAIPCEGAGHTHDCLFGTVDGTIAIDESDLNCVANQVPCSSGQFSCGATSPESCATACNGSNECNGFDENNCGCETSCTDGLDNNSNGLTDCDDSDCAGDPACSCGNGIMEPGEECDPYCIFTQNCVEQCDPSQCTPVGAAGECTCQTAGETNCTNGLDDDGDGFADCFDLDCQKSEPSCNPNPIVCGNGIAEKGEACDGSDLSNCGPVAVGTQCSFDCQTCIPPKTK